MIEQYQALIGPHNAGYYLSYFRRADERGYAPLAWHWPAFFLGMFWLLWRRQYRWAAITFCMPYVAVWTGTLVATLGMPTAAVPITRTLILSYLMVFLPMKANAIYYAWAQRQIGIAKHRLPGQSQQQLELLNKVGGISRNLPIIIMLLSMILMTLSGSITQLPAPG